MAVPSVWVVLFSGAGCTGQLPVGQGISGADARTGALRFGGASWAALRGSKVFSRRAFVTTQTLDRLKAAEAIIGFSVMPKPVNTPAASGMQMAL